MSKNGTLLLNVGPKSDGTIPEEDKRILQEIGAWLKVNGEAIYDTSVWRSSGEGPTQIEEGQFADGSAKNFTSEDIRFTVKGSSLYVTVLRFPEDGRLQIRSLGEKDASRLPHFHGIIREVSILGYEGELDWSRGEEALTILAPGIKTEYPVVCKVTID